MSLDPPEPARTWGRLSLSLWASGEWARLRDPEKPTAPWLRAAGDRGVNRKECLFGLPRSLQSKQCF